MRYRRINIVNRSLIDGPAQAAWDYLTDWARTRARPAPAGAPNAIGLKSIQLEGGATDIPRTRVLTFETLPTIRETLLRQDDETMHIQYNIEGIGPYGIRNYLATTEIDALGDTLCQATITARFDLADSDDPVAAKAFIDAAHNGVFKGMKWQLAA
jgi:hypothetical protein